MKSTSVKSRSVRQRCIAYAVRGFLLMSVCLLTFLSTTQSAFAGDPRLVKLSPLGAQVGTEVTMKVACARYTQPLELMFARPGITVTQIKPAKGNRFTAKLTIAEDCPVGIHPIRVRTGSGLSNLMTFHVGRLPELKEAEGNGSFEKAQPVELPATVNGVVQTEQVDYYRVELEEGQRLSVEIEGLRLGRTFFDPAITIFATDQSQLAHCDDAALTRQDGYFTLSAPAKGVYYIAVSEAARRGDNACQYRLHLGDFPRPRAAYPPGGRPGEKLEIAWIGEGDQRTLQTVTLPADAKANHWLYATDEQGAAPTGVPVRVVDLPRALEQEPNNNQKKATPMEVPGVATGILQESADRDVFRFAAKKGQVLDIRVFGRNLRSPVDPVLRILSSEGKSLGGNDDDQGKPDSYSRFTVKEDSDYLIEIHDHLKRGGPGFVYWVEITPREPSLEIQPAEIRRYFATTVDVPQGGLTALNLEVKRRDGAKESGLTIANLPQGVEATIPKLPMPWVLNPVVFRAKPAAALTGSRAEVGIADTGLQHEFTHRTWLIRGQNNRPMWDYFDDRLSVCVAQKLPFRLELIAPKSPIVREGAKDLKVVAHREEGFEESIAVRLLYNPHGIASNRSRSIRKKENEAAIPITANGRANLLTWPIAVIAETSIKGRVVTATEFVDLQIAEPYVRMSFPTVATPQGQDVEYVVTLEQKVPFEGEATARLQGLPHGVTAEPAKFTSKDKQVAFDLKVAPSAKVGRHRRVSAWAEITVADEQVPHNQGHGELRIDPAPTDKPNGKSQASSKAASAAEAS